MVITQDLHSFHSSAGSGIGHNQLGRPPLRIAFIDYVLQPDKPGRSGLSDVVWDMATALTDLGHEAHMIASYHSENYPDERVIVHNFAEPPIGYRNIIGQWWILKRAVAIARRLEPDIIHTPEYFSTAVAIQLGVKIPLVVTVPGNIFERIENGHDFEWFYTQILKWAARKSADSCARVITTSKKMKEWWQWTGSSPERTPLIPYGIDPTRFYPVAEAKNRLGLAEETLFFLYVGRFSKEKGLLDLLAALSRIKPLLESATVQVSLVGKGAQEQTLRRYIREEGLEQIVKIVPWVAQDELHTWYSAADALLLPSHSEGFSRTIPEAMACGTPVIGSCITGTEDHVQDGITGHLFPPHDAQALAARLQQAIKAPESLEQMGREAYAYVSQHLTWQQITKQIVDEVYCPILAQQPTLTLYPNHTW